MLSKDNLKARSPKAGGYAIALLGWLINVLASRVSILLEHLGNGDGYARRRHRTSLG
ncbi:hypothetical protein [Nostoc sp.]|uniref:hypothetical protein n=1 Tax=Nostoc sp. TaxID=1180 RepID=UPI002FF5784A